MWRSLTMCRSRQKQSFARVSGLGQCDHFYGAVIAVLPIIVGYLIARKLLKMSLLDILGSVTGGMTSTPALGTLIQTAGTDDVAVSYAATYPVALSVIVICVQLMGIYL